MNTPVEMIPSHIQARTTWEINHDLPTANGLRSLCWQAAGRHAKKSREYSRMQTQSWLNLLSRRKIKPVAEMITVVFLRLGAKVDREENLPMCFKAAKDGIADAFHAAWGSLNANGYGDDSDARFQWIYQQRRRRKYDGRANGFVTVMIGPVDTGGGEMKS